MKSSLNIFKSYFMTKPDGEVEYMNAVDFITRMLKFATVMVSRQEFYDWAKKEGIPYPCTEGHHPDGYTYHSLKTDHLMRFMVSRGYQFEEIEDM